jgi:hypothetical protein
MAHDPDRCINKRREILADGSLLPLAQLDGDAFPETSRFCQHIVSGGQTGADRAALDFAILHHYTHGGWAPRGRMAGDGIIPLKYQLTELAEGSYRQRTKRNVEDSDATLIVTVGALEGGSLATWEFARKKAKPCFPAQLDTGVLPDIAAEIRAWLRQHKVTTLNVAGPRESKQPGIYRLTRELLEAVAAAK